MMCSRNFSGGGIEGVLGIYMQNAIERDELDPKVLDGVHIPIIKKAIQVK